MTDRGHCRRNGVCWAAGVLLVLLATAGRVSASVLGIDLGTEFFKVAITSPGRPFEILLNTHTKRKTPTAVSFAENFRTFGENALAKSIRYSDQVFEYMPAMLGFNATGMTGSDVSSVVDVPFPPSTYYPYAYRVNETRGTLELKVDSDTWMSPEEILSHLFSFIKRLAEGHSSSPATHCVITVPSGFTMRQREAVSAAASLGGLTVSALVHDGAAAALHHALDIPFVVKPTDPTAAATDSGSGATPPQSTTTTADTTGSSSSSGGKGNETTADAKTADGTSTTTAAAAVTKAETKKTTRTTTLPPRPLAPRYKAFFNVGAFRTQACVVQYSTDPPHNTEKKVSVASIVPIVRVLGCAALPSTDADSHNAGIGGWQADVAIAEMMETAFVTNNLNEAQRNTFAKLAGNAVTRVRRKLLDQAKRVKQILSVNKESVFSVESLYLDTDFRKKISRDELEDALVSKVKRKATAAATGSGVDAIRSEVKLVLDEALRVAKVNGTDLLDSVELIGGGWRVPLIFSALVDEAGKDKVGMTVNAEEAMAFGAAFIAANHSNIFKTKKIYFTDASAHDYSVGVVPLPWASKEVAPVLSQPPEKGHFTTIVAKGGKFSGTRTVGFKANHDIEVTLFENNNLITKWHVRGIEETHAKRVQELTSIQQESHETAELTPAKLSLLFEISPIGVVGLPSATLAWVTTGTPTDITTSTTAATTNSTAATTNSTAASTTTTTTTAADAAATSSTTPKAASDPKEDEASATTTTTTVPAAKPPADKKRLTKSVTISVVEQGKPLPMPADEFTAARKRLLAFERRDTEAVSNEAARNTFESYIYSTRPRLEDEETLAVSTEAERKTIAELLDKDEEWLLFEEGSTANKTTVDKRMYALTTLLGPVLERATEHKLRPVVISRAKEIIQTSKTKIEDLSIKMPWLSTNDTNVPAEILDDVEKWFDEMLEKQKKAKTTDPPAFKAEEVYAKLDSIVTAVEKMKTIPKPKPKPTKVETAKPAAGKDSQQTDDTMAGTDPDAATRNSTTTTTTTTTVGSDDNINSTTSSVSDAAGTEGVDKADAATGAQQAGEL